VRAGDAVRTALPAARILLDRAGDPAGPHRSPRDRCRTCASANAIRAGRPMNAMETEATAAKRN